MTAPEIRRLAGLGLTADQLAAVAEMLDARSCAKPSTERVRAFRQRAMKRSETFQPVSETVSETQNPLSLAPSPLPLASPSPRPHTHTPAPTHTHEAGPVKTLTKRQQIESDIAEANRQEIPILLNTADFRAAWAEWCEHRAGLYRTNPAKRWTGLAARNTLAECERNAPESAAAVMVITAAISNGWQGLVWDRMQPARKAAAPAAPNKVPVHNKWS